MYSEIENTIKQKEIDVDSTYYILQSIKNNTGVNKIKLIYSNYKTKLHFLVNI